MEQNNPFLPPKANLEEGGQDSVELASRGQRLLAAIVDAIIGMAFGIPLMFLMGTWSSVKTGVQPPWPLLLGTSAIAFCVFMLVHGYFLKTAGQTVGKKLVGIRIVDLSNELPAFGKLLGARYLPISLVSLVPVVGNILPMIDVLFILGSERRCVHDRIAGTRVVRVRAANA